MSKLEKGASYPGLEIIAKLATVLEVELAELLRAPSGKHKKRGLRLAFEIRLSSTDSWLIQSKVFVVHPVVALDGEIISRQNFGAGAKQTGNVDCMVVI